MVLVADSTYRLSTGREFYANAGIVGMSPRTIDGDFGDFEPNAIPEGYDGGITMWDQDDPSKRWTDAELTELHDFMIGMWSEWLRRRRADVARLSGERK